MKVTLNPIAITGLRDRIINRHETRKALTDILNSTPGLLNHLLEILNRETNQETNRETNQKHKPTLSEDAKEQIIAKITNRHQTIADKKPTSLLQNIQFPKISDMGLFKFFKSIPKKLSFYDTNIFDHYRKYAEQEKLKTLLKSTTREANTLLNTLNPPEKKTYLPNWNFLNKKKTKDKYKPEPSPMLSETAQTSIIERIKNRHKAIITPLIESTKPEATTLLNELYKRDLPVLSSDSETSSTMSLEQDSEHDSRDDDDSDKSFPTARSSSSLSSNVSSSSIPSVFFPSLNPPAIGAIIDRIHNRHPSLVQILQNTEEQANLLLESLDKPAKTYKLENITPILQSAEKDANDLLSALFKGPTGTTIGTTGPTGTTETSRGPPTGPTGTTGLTVPTGTTSKTDNLNNLGELIINGEVFVMSPDGKSMIQKAIP